MHSAFGCRFWEDFFFISAFSEEAACMAPEAHRTWVGGHTRHWAPERSRLVIVPTIGLSRCSSPGMKINRMPLLVWMNLVMAGMVLLAITPLSAAQIMLLIDRYLGGHFFDTQAGGSAVLWMHFFWIFGHPEVYVLIIPCFAFMSEIIPVFSRKPIFGYPVMVAATVCIAFVSMSVWAHHMFTIGMNSYANSFFTITTMAVGVPTGIKIFNWLATFWGGKIIFKV